MINTSFKKYGVDRLNLVGEFYDAFNTSNMDIPFYLKQAKKARGAVLELCCGTGRITLPLAKAGIDITGVDISPSMLNRAKEKAADAGLQTAFLLGDMRKLQLKKKYRLVFIPFNSLQNTYSLADIEKVLQVVRSHLAIGGKFIFDIFNPSIEYIVKMKKLQKNKYKFTLEDGRRVSIDEICAYDSAGQVNRVTWLYRIDGKKPMPQKLDMRCFYPQEIDALLKYNGFKVVKKFGFFDEKPFTSESMKQICICSRLANCLVASLSLRILFLK